MVREDFWNKTHLKYANQDWSRKPTLFAQEVVARFPRGANILDLGAGQGQDSIFFGSLGFSVVAVDFSEIALETIEELVALNDLGNVTVVKHDLRDRLPFVTEDFDVVYAHLSLHYFSDKRTRSLLREIARVLRIGGLLCALVNSIDDPEYGQGTRIEADYYELADGDFKRYFSRLYMVDIIKDLFIPILLEDKGKTHKDPTDAFIKLVATRI